MPIRFFFCKNILAALALAAFIPALCPAQTPDPMFERLEQMMRRMDEQMRRSMSFDTSFQRGQLQISPDSNSFFYFHADTSFNNMGDSDFFQFSPFGDLNQRGSFDLDSLFNQFFNGRDRPDERRGRGDFPSDDGQQAPGEDNLLPEERLRLQEEQQANPDSRQSAPQPGKPAKPKVKTIRI